MKITPTVSGRVGVGTGTGGDLTGPLPSPTVTGLQGRPVCDDAPTITDVLTWNGTEWCGDTPGGGGGAGLTWFDVTDPTYGAVHDGVTDDTVAIQAAITACMAAGGGWVYFPNGIYAIKGALQSTTTYNSQLTIPQNAVSGANPPISIGFLGLGPAGQWNHGTSGAWDPGLSGAILLSDWNGTISNHPAVIAASKWDAVYPAATFNWIEVTFRNIEIRTPANPKLSAIQMAGTASLSLINTTVSTDTDSAGMSLPSNSNAVGITGPLVDNANPPYLFQNLFVDGYYTGILMSEVTHGVDVSVHHCTVGIEMAGPQNHAISIERLLFVAVKTGIKITGGTFYLDIHDLFIEHKASGTFARVYDVDDGSNYGKGHVIYHTVLAGVGVDNDLLVNGGTGVTFTSLDNGTFGGASFATPAIVLGTAAAAGAAATVIRSDATIAAFDATVPTTSAIGDSAATGSVARAARRDHTHGREALSTATPLVELGAGAVGTGVKSSREDHVHPAAAAATGHWEVVMTVGITDPPEPVWNVAGDDWIYVFVP